MSKIKKDELQKEQHVHEQNKDIDEAQTQPNQEPGAEADEVASPSDKEVNEQEDMSANTDLSVAELLKKVSEAEQKADENYQKYLRSQADFDNLRRRTRLEKEEQAKYASLPLVEQLLPVLDNFERALTASKASDTTDASTLVQGIEMVFRQFEQALTASGLEVIQTVGEPFDPNVHQAVMQEESTEYESGIVLEELQKGYKLKDRVIRPAMVKVSS